MTDIDDLIERMKAATGPDRALDAAIYVAVTPRIKTADDLIYYSVPSKADGCASGTYWHHERSGMSLRTAPAYTASIDATRAVAREMGWHVFSGGIIHWCDVWGPESKKRLATISHPATEPLACCIALLQAIKETSK